LEAAVREAQEETGLEVGVDHLVGIYQCPRTSEGFGVVNFVFFSEVLGGVLRTSCAHPVVRYFSTDEITEMVSARMVRGRHIPAAIADHEAGRRLATSLIQVVPEMGQPGQVD
jgi:8-oxo-dGTP pyrophosphatase MutT (NUDIX family)